MLVLFPHNERKPCIDQSPTDFYERVIDSNKERRQKLFQLPIYLHQIAASLWLRRRLLDFSHKSNPAHKTDAFDDDCKDEPACNHTEHQNDRNLDAKKVVGDREQPK